jgi:UDP-N-acetylglucosamine:LPS N-acetylglucosamine transferase
VINLVEGWTGEEVVIRHVVGPRGWSAGERALTHSPGVDYRPVDYEHDLPTVLAAADLAICRSGATTVAELAVLGVPAVLVPLPGAPGDHQTANARQHADAGCGVVLEDDRLEQGDLAGVVASLLADPGRRRAMSTAALVASKPDAAERVVEIIAHHATERREDEGYG